MTNKRAMYRWLLESTATRSDLLAKSLKLDQAVEKCMYAIFASHHLGCLSWGEVAFNLPAVSFGLQGVECTLRVQSDHFLQFQDLYGMANLVISLMIPCHSFVRCRSRSDSSYRLMIVIISSSANSCDKPTLCG